MIVYINQSFNFKIFIFNYDYLAHKLMLCYYSWGWILTELKLIDKLQFTNTLFYLLITYWLYSILIIAFKILIITLNVNQILASKKYIVAQLM